MSSCSSGGSAVDISNSGIGGLWERERVSETNSALEDMERLTRVLLDSYKYSMLDSARLSRARRGRREREERVIFAQFAHCLRICMDLSLEKGGELDVGARFDGVVDLCFMSSGFHLPRHEIW